jgi:hypothetical protein
VAADVLGSLLDLSHHHTSSYVQSCGDHILLTTPAGQSAASLISKFQSNVY